MRVPIAFTLLVVLAVGAQAAPQHHHKATSKPAPAASNSTTPGYHGLGQSHQLLSKNEDGTQIVLNDHSNWTVDDGDASMSSIWDSQAKLTIASTDDTDFPFSITNEKTGETVHAQFGGYGAVTASNTP